MKKLNYIVMFAAVAAAALVSCQKAAEKEDVVIGEGIKVTLTTNGVTKTFIDGTTPYWLSTDAVGVFTGTNTVNAEFSNTEATGEYAEFEGSVPAAGTYYAYYPYSVNGANENGALIIIPQDQEPTPTSFDGAADLLLSEGFEISSTDTESKDVIVSFRRLAAFLKVSFTDGTTGTKLDGEYATAVSVQEDNGDNRIVGTFRLKTDGPSPISSGWKKVNATYPADTYQITSPDHAAWFGILPQTFANGSTLIFTAETDNYIISKTVTMPAEVEVEAGSILPLTVSLKDANVTEKPKTIKIEKLWERLSTTETNWLTAIGGNAGSDCNIAIDDENVYITEFGGSKKIWAIDIATGETVSSVNTEAVASTGYDGSIFLSCARVVKRNNGTPVLMATNLFQDGSSENPTGRLYIWDEGIDNAPKVKKLQQWGAGSRLGDTWTTYGNFEDCWMIMGTQTGNGFVTFRVPTGESASLISRLAIDTQDFCSYYPFPGDLIHGMFTWRGGDHDDGLAYRNRLMTVNSTEEAIKTQGAHASELTKLGTWMGNYENNNGSGFNYIEFNGKRFVIWVINMADSKTFDIVVKQGTTDTPWQTIIDTPAATITSNGGFAFRESLVGGMATTWKQATDCAVWNNGDEVYIAVNKVNVGLAVYRLYAE